MTLYSEKCATPDMPADGLQTSWPFDFRIDDTDPPESRLVVTGPSGVPAIIDPALYTVVGYGLDEGGFVTYPLTGPLPPGSSVRVERDPAFLQPARLRNQGAYQPDTVEFALDRGVKQAQWLQHQLDGHEARLTLAEAEIVLLEAGGGGGRGGGGGGTPTPLPFATGQSIGLAMDGVTDDAPKLQRAIDALAAVGGGSIWVQPPSACYLDGKLRVHGGVNLLGPTDWALGGFGGLSVQGAVAGDPAADGLRLAADVTAGAGQRTVPVDTGVLGGGPVSSFLAAGDRITLIGRLDSAGTPLEWQEAKVATVGTSSFTIDRDLVYSFKAAYPPGAYEAGWGVANRTLIRKQVTASLTVGVGTLGALRLTVATADVTKFSVGDWVLAQDDKKAGDVAGTSTALIHRSLVQIRDITGTRVTVDRWIEHALELAYGARLTLVDVESGTIEGPVLTFTAPADLSVEPVRTCEIAYCVGAAIFDPSVPNQDPYGSVSDALRIKLSADCGIFGGRVSYPKYTGAGQGYGFIFDWCVDCVAADLEARGCRHSVVFSGSSRCHADRLASIDCRLSDLEFHGAGEQRCWAQDPTIVGGYGTASASRAAFAFGNSFHLAGSYNCSVKGGTVSHFKAPQTTPGTPDFTVFAIVFEPGIRGCRVERTKFFDIDQLAQILDNPSQPSFVAEDCSIDECELDTCAGYIGYFEGNHYTATSPGAGVYRIKDLRIRNLTAKNVGKLFRFTRINGLQLLGLKLDGVTIDATEPYLFRGSDVQRMVVTRADVTGVSKGPQLTNCPSAQIDRNVFRGLGATPAVLEDAGGNDATVWAWNSAPGVTTELGGALTSAITYVPRTPDSLNIVDGGIRIVPAPAAKGVIKVWSLSGEFIQVDYQLDVNPALAVVEFADATPNAVAVVGTSVVGTGTAGKLSVIVDRVGATLAIVNKRGGSRGVFWSFPGEV